MQTVEKVRLYIDESYDVRKNIVTLQYEIKKKQEQAYHRLADSDINQIWFEVDGKLGEVTPEEISSIIELRDYQKEYNPFKEYITLLPEWDGSDHIEKLALTITPKDMSGEEVKTKLTNWLVNVLLCALEIKMNKECLIIVGDQGIGKTTFLRNLVPPELEEYYKEETIDLNTKDGKLKLSNSLIINMYEIGELKAKKISKIKELNRSSEFEIRLPYNHFSKVVKRRASFCGSLQYGRFLDNSKFISVIKAENIDYMAPINHSQLYAQLVSRINSK